MKEVLQMQLVNIANIFLLATIHRWCLAKMIPQLKEMLVNDVLTLAIPTEYLLPPTL